MTAITFTFSFARIATSLLGAFVITLGLLLLMNLLIASPDFPPETSTPKPVEVVMHEPVIKTIKKDPLQKPDDPAVPPMDKIDLPYEAPLEPANVLAFDPVKRDRITIKGNAGAITDGEYLPIVKVEPNYPRSALRHGIEGWVVVEFTVTTSGSVRDAYVVDAQPAKIFDRAATKAALKFKYKPRVIDGQPVEVSGIRNKITFAIAK